MAEPRERPDPVDFVVTSLSPILIIGLIGSLVFFLVEILYAGKYEGRLLWTLFFFVGGIVLVVRVAIVVDVMRARAYGLILAGACWLALTAFIDYPADSLGAQFSWLINLLLIAVVYWCAEKLTWDCTFIDENRKASGKGLLSASGLEPRPGESREPLPTSSLKGSWWDRWQKFREKRAKRPHTPGTTVVYFSLAALPIFGLGQSLIPSSESSRRTYTFWLAAGYVSSGLGLLLTTSFLGMRRYLRQRKASMPASITGAWLGLGATLILGVVLVGALLPRPYSETPIWGIHRLGSADRNASKNAVLRDGTPGKGEGNSGNQTTAGEGKNVGEKGQPGGNGPQGKGKEGSGDGKGNGSEKGSSKSGGEEKNENGDPTDRSRTEEERGQQAGGRSSEDKSNRGSGDQRGSRFSETRLGNALEKVAGFLKWLVFILAALAIAYILVRWGLRYLANFTGWARDLLAWWNRFLEGLFGKRRSAKAGSAAEPASPPPPRRIPFSEFSNPFLDGSSEGRSTEELTRYSFTALEAWAADRNLARRKDETPLEFAIRLATAHPEIGGEVHQLAILMASLAYSPEGLPKSAREHLEAFWDRITSQEGAYEVVG